eukprot:CAMPEP_0114511660 /NCGR_PEP_ID=MMETSP0109-20121206/14524_1 /TAXON_ID=29199 /ORGANISM="Chlorarachnion reptans, Strain CCCM449" /LENGTH=58 /DNA_ID=CAMNT_0001691219 /DNA_START=628 /DNA_END=801 /DNA_ORIENTATION=-
MVYLPADGGRCYNVGAGGCREGPKGIQACESEEEEEGWMDDERPGEGPVRLGVETRAE